MDPVAAIGLAGNIVQFLDFSCKLLSGAKGLYNSSTGASDENEVLETVSNDLRLLNDELTAPSAYGAIPDPIRGLADQCKDVAIQLIEVLKEIKVKGTHRRRSSFVQALRGVWKKEQIEGSPSNSIDCVARSSEKNSELQRILASLADKNSRLAMDGARQLDNLKVGVDAAISNLKSEIERQHTVGMKSAETSQAKPPIDLEAIVPSSESLTDLSMKLLDFANHVGTAASDQSLLDSLWFNNIREREENVATSHVKTFEWAIDPSSLITLRDWLRNQNGVYWIMGKAGSGKSTLMKYLVNHPEVAQILQSWAGPKEIVTASYFFWNAGTAMQKSQEGLFRSILYEILRKCPDMIHIVCESKARTFQPFVNNIKPWTRQELWQALRQLKQQSGIRARFCFFIDGLDEYDGEPGLVVEVLEGLREWQDIKLCVSSRPWNEFVDAFGQAPITQLALEDLTREDIRTYVRKTLEANPRFRALNARERRLQDLVQEIVEKARGVFLWVVLVVKSLLRGLTNADKFSILQRRLREFPETLEKYFSHMLHSVEPIYREQTAQFFRFALEAAEPLPLLTYSFLDQDDIDHVVVPYGTLSTADDIAVREDDMQRQLVARCKGLSEVISSWQSSHYNYNPIRKVDFLHRTARDFLLTKDMQTMLTKSLKPDFEPDAYLCRALLATLRSINPVAFQYLRQQQIRLLEDLIYYAHRLEVKSGLADISFMDQVYDLVSRQPSRFGIPEGEDGFLHYLLHKKVYLYITEALARESALQTWDRTVLLILALCPVQTKRFVSGYDPRMVEILLEHGAESNHSFKETTVWGNFLSDLLLEKDADYSSGFPANDNLRNQVIESMLKHGADQQQVIVNNHDEEMKYRSAKSILRDVLGDRKATDLLNKYKTPQTQYEFLPSTLFRWRASK